MPSTAINQPIGSSLALRIPAMDRIAQFGGTSAISNNYVQPGSASAPMDFTSQFDPNSFERLSVGSQSPGMDISRFSLRDPNSPNSFMSDSVKDPSTTPFGGSPDKQGGWVSGAQVGLGVAQVGLDAYNAVEQSKMNKFMRGYYGDQMDMMKTDFSNVARGANEALAAKRQRILSAQGQTTGTDANTQGVAAYMDEWGAQESV